MNKMGGSKMIGSKETENIVHAFHRYFRDLWPDSKPLIKLFKTASRGYLYDTGTNRILACSDLEFSLLHNLMTMDIGEALDKTQSSYPQDEFLQALEGIRTAIKEKNILKTKKATQFGLSSHYENLEDLIRKSLGMIQLEVTERCNLRCEYCIYNPHFTQKRNHGIRDMSLDTAYRAIDYLAQNSPYKEDVAVTFYGGEPLIRFPFVQSCVQYAQRMLSKKDLHFSMTTNATLLTPETAKYFAKKGFGMHVSLDGPEDIHDQYRKDANGTGSFHRTTSGLKMLYDAYGDQKQKISLSIVYAPPFSEKKVSLMAQLWDECSWLPKDIALTIAYAQGYFSLKNIPEQRGIDFSLFEWAIKNFVENHKRGTRAHPIASNFVERKLVDLVQRPILTAPSGKYHLNGCCIPAVRKLFVSVDGSFLLCERMGMAPEIGNVLTGVDVERVQNVYVKEYDKKSLPICSECWALQLCNICYMQAFYNGRFDIRIKNEYCSGQRHINLESLKLYCSLKEISESGLDYLMEWEVR